MKKIIALAAAGLVSMGTTAHAWDNRYEHHHHAPGWVAPLMLGAVAGAVVGGVVAQPRVVEPIRCYDMLVGYDAWNRPVYQRICR